MPASPFEGFAGPSYATLSPAESIDRSLNYYFEANEVPYRPKGPATLYNRPGSKPFGAIPPAIAGQVRAMLQFDGNGVPDGAVFGVTGSTFWQLGPDGTQTNIGTVLDDGKPAHIAVNAASVGQVFVASAGRGYCLSGGVFAEIPNDGINFFGARDVTFVDGYFIVLSDTTNNQQFQISAINDGLTWSGLDIGLLLGQSDPLQRVITNIEYLYFLGTRRGEIWYNSGNALFPFVIESGAFIEVGTNAPGSVCQSSNGQSTTIYWLGQDARGGNVAMRASGLTSQRISDHAVEAAWSNKDPKRFNGQVYPTTDDCICYPFTWNGHSLVRYIFPTAGAGWDFDITESARAGFQVWNPVAFTDQNGVLTAPFERAHAYAFGMHLIGSGGADGTPGAIYSMDPSTYTDCVGSPFGQPITTATQAETTLDIAPADTTLSDVMFGATAPATPFYFIVGGGPAVGGELILCTEAVLGMGIGFPYTLTVVRAQGGSTAQSWPSPAIFTVVTLPGFTLTRDRIVRLPFNNGLRSILDRLEVFGQSGVGVPAANMAFSATATLDSNTFLVDDTTALSAGQIVSGDPVSPGSTIVTVNTNTSVVLNSPALSSGTFPLTAQDPTPGANPQMLLRISEDGGVNFGTEIEMDMGESGETTLRWVRNRLGPYRDGAIWLRVTEPVFVCLTGAAIGLRKLAS